jgi:hypothetical protein
MEKSFGDNMYNMPCQGARPTTLLSNLIMHLLFPNKHSNPSSSNKATKQGFFVMMGHKGHYSELK